MPPINKQKGYSIPIQLAKVLRAKAPTLGLNDSEAARDAITAWIGEKFGMTVQDIYAMEIPD